MVGAICGNCDGHNEQGFDIYPAVGMVLSFHLARIYGVEHRENLKDPEQVENDVLAEAAANYDLPNGEYPKRRGAQLGILCARKLFAGACEFSKAELVARSKTAIEVYKKKAPTTSTAD